jgi:hypothetical protein
MHNALSHFNLADDLEGVFVSLTRSNIDKGAVELDSLSGNELSELYIAVNTLSESAFSEANAINMGFESVADLIDSISAAIEAEENSRKEK